MHSLADYRDDGPLAQALGRVLRSPVPDAVHAALACVVMALAVAFDAGAAGAVTITGVTAFVVLAAAGRMSTHRSSWLTPPLLRLGEYGFVLAVAARGGTPSRAAAYALLAAVAFHHYDVVYRLRHQGAQPPAWVGRVGLGWDGRMLAVALLAVTGALPVGMLAGAACLAAVFVTESVRSWIRAAGPAGSGRLLTMEEGVEE